MNASLTIRFAHITDALSLTELGITTFVEKFAEYNAKADMDSYLSDEMNLERITAELTMPDNVFFLAFWESELAGYAKVRSANPPAELRDFSPLEIERIYVLQQYQNKKIGAALMERCFACAADRKHNVVWLGVWEHNRDAIRFYERIGFSLFGSHDFVLGSDVQTDVLMKKELF